MQFSSLHFICIISFLLKDNGAMKKVDDYQTTEQLLVSLFHNNDIVTKHQQIQVNQSSCAFRSAVIDIRNEMRDDRGGWQIQKQLPYLSVANKHHVLLCLQNSSTLYYKRRCYRRDTLLVNPFQWTLNLWQGCDEASVKPKLNTPAHIWHRWIFLPLGEIIPTLFIVLSVF